jgi:DNA modification methylase
MPPIKRRKIETTHNSQIWAKGGSALWLGDCRRVAEEMPESSVDLLFADPPFNIGYEYDGYDDNKTDEEYLDFTREWLSACMPLLKPTASVFVAIGIKYQAEMKKLLDGYMGWWRDTICWHYTFGPRQESRFTPSWVAIHYYTKDPKKFTWNADAVRVPSARQLKYNDRRAVSAGKLPDNCWVLLPAESQGCFQDGDNAILESRVCGTFKERTGHPCQMPTKVLERIIKVASKPGDVVLDPFIGSGTTGDVALSLGRKIIGIDTSENYLRDICIPRLEKVRNTIG